MRSRRTLVALIVVAAATSCDSSTIYTFRNEGQVCLFPEPPPPRSPLLDRTTTRTYAAGQPLFVQLTAVSCLSGSCSHELRAECTATLEGNVIQIRSTSSFRAQGDQCTKDCR